MSVLKKRSEAAKERNLGGKRCVRFSISINNEYDRKLSKLAISCGMTKSEMSDQLLRIALDSPNVLDWLQQKFNKIEEYKVRPTVINNKVYY
ncbi:ribbon-helix-helix protein, CopG family [Bacillus salipaludis]|uniref:Ribbon-helix-helix protein, CopG family n=1 Tax=Bacillus salipaludis TaxID=2547811 RepID=A0A4V3ASW7_9BACI|nr:ribbon-helix-helix protein, CopG family [Bacillus salipaludis]TDK54750.1 ribbon-helix-helix protein, CopG family [Bacillus salipaludis]